MYVTYKGGAKMERVGVVLDFFNFQNVVTKSEAELNYEKFLEYLGDLEEGRKLVDAYAYFNLNYTTENTERLLIEDIEKSGFLIKKKINYSKEEEECNFYQTEMIIDILKFVSELKIDILVFGSVDSIFYPLLKTLRDKGIRVELISVENYENERLKGISQGVISINEFIKENIGETNDINNLENEEE